MSRIGDRLTSIMRRNHLTERRLAELARPEDVPATSPVEQSHLEHCDRCHRLLVGYRRTEEVLSGVWRDRPIQGEVRTGAGTERIEPIDGVRVGHPGAIGRVGRQVPRYATVLTAAVLIGVVVGVGLLGLRGGRPASSGPAASMGGGAPSSAPASPAAPSAGPSDATDPYREVLVTPDAAVAAVKAMSAVPQTALGGSGSPVRAVQTSDLVATGPFEGAWDRYYQVAGRDVDATVDVHDGHVETLLLVGLVGASPSTTSITADQALAVASSFLTQRQIGTDGLTASVVKKDRGDVKTFVATWQRVVNGAIVPNSRMVEMDASTGVVFNLNDTNRPYADPPVPAIGRDQAVFRAEAAVSESGAAASASVDQTPATFVIESTSLQVSFTMAGVQQLQWSIELGYNTGQIYDSYAAVSVDAMTGVATVVGRG